MIDYVYDNRLNSVTIPFTANSDIENAIHCIAVMSLLGVSDEVIAERMSRLTPVGTRLQCHGGCQQLHAYMRCLYERLSLTEPGIGLYGTTHDRRPHIDGDIERCHA